MCNFIYYKSYNCKKSSIFLTIVRKYSMENLNRFKDNLKELRIEKGLGQVELAKAVGVSKGIISLWENGLREPNMSSLIALATFFGVSIDELVGLEN